MKIGLVLPEVPQYSETFFNFKINGLVESGFEVLLFTGNKKNSKNRANEKVKVIPAYPVYRSSSIYQFLLFIYVVSFRFIFSLKKTLKLISLESKVGKNFSERMKSVYLNAHILKENIDVLHFGFTTMAIQRENVAKAMNAKMSVSFRGYDINIYPLKNPDCYKNVWRNIDKVHTISNYLREKAVSLGLPEKTPYLKITPAIDFEKLSQNKIRTDISVPKILTVGRLNWIKNYETAISDYF